MQRRNRRRVYGPYEERGGWWRVVVVAEDSSRTSRFCETRREAERLVRETADALGLHEEARTVKQAIDAYELHQKFDKGNKPVSVADSVRRLHRFFGPDVDTRLSHLEPDTCDDRYAVLCGELATDSHRNILAETKTFLGWCVAKKWLDANPAAETKGRGRRRHGKPKLRIDEARAWTSTALLKAQSESGAVAALMALLMGMRASEIVRRVVRDVDDDGQLLWIDSGKTAAARRTLTVPELLRPFLLALTKDRKPDAPLFPSRRREYVRGWVLRICRLAKVPAVCAHSMRGLHADLALEAGATSELAARALGHESVSTTEQSYASASSLAASRSKRALRVLSGGKCGKTAEKTPRQGGGAV